jgi:hypothetical protein
MLEILTPASDNALSFCVPGVGLRRRSGVPGGDGGAGKSALSLASLRAQGQTELHAAGDRKLANRIFDINYRMLSENDRPDFTPSSARLTIDQHDR